MTRAVISRRNWFRSLPRALHQLPMTEAIRGGVVCVVPAVLAAMLHDPLLCWSAIAAFWTCLADSPGSALATRVQAGLLFGLLGAAASGIAIAAGALPGLSVVLTGAVVFGAGLLQVRGGEFGFRALLAATAFAVSAAFPVQGWKYGATYGAHFLLGNLWAVAVLASLGSQDRLRRARKDAFAFLAEVANLVTDLVPTLTDGHLRVAPDRARLRTRLDQMQVAICQLDVPPRDLSVVQFAGERIVALLAGLQSLLPAEHRLGQVHVRVAPLLVPVLDDLARVYDAWSNQVRRGWPLAVSPLMRERGHLVAEAQASLEWAGRAGATDDDHAWIATCIAPVLELATLVTRDSLPGPQLKLKPVAASHIAWPTREYLRHLWAQMKLQTPELRHTARRALAAALAVGVVRLIHLEQGYWLALTTIFVMQSTIAQTVKVSAQRLAGTIGGASLAAALAVSLHGALPLALCILPLAIGTFAARAVSHVPYVLFLTPQFVLVAEVASPPGEPWYLSWARVQNSALGAALAVVISLLLWPEWQRNRLATVLRRTLGATSAYLDAVLEQLDERPGEVARPLAELRREACLAIDQLEALLSGIQLESAFSTRRARSAGLAIQWLRRLLGITSLLECPQVPIDAYERKRLGELAHWAVAVLLGARPSLPQFALCLPPASASPSGSYQVRHIEQELVAGVLAVSAALPAGARVSA